MVGGVNYAQHLLCDLTTPSQCASVAATGQVMTGGWVYNVASGGVWNQFPGDATAAYVNIKGCAAGVCNTNGQAAMAASAPVTIASNQALGDPCTWKAKSYAPVSITGSTQIVTGTGGLKTYLCSYHVVTATAQNIALVEGTGSTCATNIYGLAGGTTAATGWNFAANSGIARGDGNATVAYGSADANATAANICLLLSGSGQVSGAIAYVQQ